MSISVIIPAFNEAHRIGDMLDKYLAYFGEQINFLIVLDGCIDNTEEVVKVWQVKFPNNLQYIVINKSKGKGHAVRYGFQVETHSNASLLENHSNTSRTDIIGFVDADGSTPPEEFAKLLEKIKSPANDVVIASRYAPGATVVDRDSWLRVFSAVIFQKIVRLFTGLKFYDTQCGAKVFTKEVIDRILPSLKIDNMAFDVEILLASQKNNFKILEIPTVWHEADVASPFLGSKFKFMKTAFIMFKSIFLLK